MMAYALGAIVLFERPEPQAQQLPARSEPQARHLGSDRDPHNLNLMNALRAHGLAEGVLRTRGTKMTYDTLARVAREGLAH